MSPESFSNNPMEIAAQKQAEVARQNEELIDALKKVLANIKFEEEAEGEKASFEGMHNLEPLIQEKLLGESEESKFEI